MENNIVGVNNILNFYIRKYYITNTKLINSLLSNFKKEFLDYNNISSSEENSINITENMDMYLKRLFDKISKLDDEDIEKFLKSGNGISFSNILDNYLKDNPIEIKNIIKDIKKIKFEYGFLNPIRKQETVWIFDPSTHKLDKQSNYELPLEPVGIKIIKNYLIVKQLFFNTKLKELETEYFITSSSVVTIFSSFERTPSLTLDIYPNVNDSSFELFTLVRIWSYSADIKILPLFQKIHIPDKYKKCPKTLYRGIKISNESYNLLKKGESISLKKRPYSSWTPKITIATNFIRTKIKAGIVIKYEIKDKGNILININSIGEDLFNHPIMTTHAEKEIVLKNTTDILTVDPSQVVVWRDKGLKNIPKKIKNLEQAKTLLKAAISLLKNKIISAINIEQEFEKHKGKTKTEDQLKYLGKLIDHYNSIYFEGKLPKPTSIDWVKGNKFGGIYSVTHNSFKFNPDLFKAPFSTFRDIILHEMCHQAEIFLPTKDDETSIEKIGKTRFGLINKGGHTSKSWKYWTQKTGISSSRTFELIFEEHIQQIDKETKISKPKKYLPVKFLYRNSWEEGLLAMQTNEKIKSWYVAFRNKNNPEGAYLSHPLDKFYEVSPQKAEELSNDKKLRSLVNYCIKRESY